jgi:ABC-2 type transport system permease protein
MSVALTYRAQAAIWMVGGLVPLAMMLIWLEIANDGVVGGYNRSDFILYFLGMFFVRQATSVWVLFTLDRSIRRGELSLLLLRPIPPILQHSAEHIGELILRIPIIISIFLAGVILTGVGSQISCTSILLFSFALIGAWLIVFNLYYCLGLLAFWIGNAIAFDPLLFSLYTMLGGTIIPLDMFPAGVRMALSYLPFAAALDFPVQLLLGKLDVREIGLGFTVQAAWVIVLSLIRSTLWYAGLKRYSAAGA